MYRYCWPNIRKLVFTVKKSLECTVWKIIYLFAIFLIPVVSSANTCQVVASKEYELNSYLVSDLPQSTPEFVSVNGHLGSVYSNFLKPLIIRGSENKKFIFVSKEASQTILIFPIDKGCLIKNKPPKRIVLASYVTEILDIIQHGNYFYVLLEEEGERKLSVYKYDPVNGVFNSAAVSSTTTPNAVSMSYDNKEQIIYVITTTGRMHLFSQQAPYEYYSYQQYLDGPYEGIVGIKASYNNIFLLSDNYGKGPFSIGYLKLDDDQRNGKKIILKRSLKMVRERNILASPGYHASFLVAFDKYPADNMLSYMIFVYAQGNLYQYSISNKSNEFKQVNSSEFHDGSLLTSPLDVANPASEVFHAPNVVFATQFQSETRQRSIFFIINEPEQINTQYSLGNIGNGIYGSFTFNN